MDAADTFIFAFNVESLVVFTVSNAFAVAAGELSPVDATVVVLLIFLFCSSDNVTETVFPTVPTALGKKA